MIIETYLLKFNQNTYYNMSSYNFRSIYMRIKENIHTKPTPHHIKIYGNHDGGIIAHDTDLVAGRMSHQPNACGRIVGVKLDPVGIKIKIYINKLTYKFKALIINGVMPSVHINMQLSSDTGKSIYCVCDLIIPITDDV